MSNASKLVFKSIPLLKIMIPYIIGIVLCQQINIIIPFTSIIILLLLQVVLILMLYLNKKTYTTQSLIYALFFSLGYFNAATRIPKVINHSESINSIIGICKNKSIQKNNHKQVTINTIQIRDSIHNNWIAHQFLINVYLDSSIDRNYNSGDTLILSPIKVNEIKNSRNPFAFNFKQFQNLKGIAHQAYCNNDQIIYLPKLKRSHIEKVQQYAHQIFETNLKDTQTLALFKAMILGDEQLIDQEDRNIYSHTGVIHIVSISGAHIATLFLAIHFVFTRIFKIKKKWLLAILSLSIIWGYIFLAEMSTPAIRAALMFSFIQLSIIMNRKHNMYNVVLSSALIILIFNPNAIFEIGFQLSYIAVLSILLFTKHIQNIWKPQNKVLQWLWTSVAVCLSVEILIAPLVAFYFHQFPVLFLPANIIASVFMGALLGIGFVMLVLSPFTFIVNILGRIADVISGIFHKMLNFMNQFQIEALESITISFIELILIFITIIFIAITIRMKERKYLTFSMLCCIILTLIQIQHKYMLYHQERFIVFNQKLLTIHSIKGNKALRISKNPSINLTEKNTAIALGYNMQNKQQLYHIVKGKRIFIVESIDEKGIPYKADILIPNSIKPSIQYANLLINTIQPKLIVIGNNLTKKEMNVWNSIAKQNHIAIHNIKKDGAFILE
jgi:competence protein ComEC